MSSKKRIWISTAGGPGRVWPDQVLPVDWLNVTQRRRDSHELPVLPG